MPNAYRTAAALAGPLHGPQRRPIDWEATAAAAPNRRYVPATSPRKAPTQAPAARVSVAAVLTAAVQPDAPDAPAPLDGAAILSAARAGVRAYVPTSRLTPHEREALTADVATLLWERECKLPRLRALPWTHRVAQAQSITRDRMRDGKGWRDTLDAWRPRPDRDAPDVAHEPLPEGLDVLTAAREQDRRERVAAGEGREFPADAVALARSIGRQYPGTDAQRKRVALAVALDVALAAGAEDPVAAVAAAHGMSAGSVKVRASEGRKLIRAAWTARDLARIVRATAAAIGLAADRDRDVPAGPRLMHGATALPDPTRGLDAPIPDEAPTVCLLYGIAVPLTARPDRGARRAARPQHARRYCPAVVPSPDPAAALARLQAPMPATTHPAPEAPRKAGSGRPAKAHPYGGCKYPAPSLALREYVSRAVDAVVR